MSFRLKGWWREGWDSDVKRLGMLVAWLRGVLPGGRATPRKIGWGCAARISKPLCYLWPKSSISHTLFMT